MNGFIESFIPFFRRFAVESILLGSAFILTLVSITIYVYNSQEKHEDAPSINNHVSVRENKGSMMVEVSGAVYGPGVFETTVGARLKDAIALAGGVSEIADREFFSRNFNLSRYLTDQEKIYVPSYQEVTNDVFASRKQLLDYTAPQNIPQVSTEITNQEVVNINVATAEELDTLPGIGTTIATKIIQSRPYATIEELVSKKAVNKGVFEQIKNLISL
ncbi:ComEA family DNA-binding protein [Candidatus Roizmanbacteria bacterium]|nr:ComEA family DNA-binding protein [Candidatus Roizmanbacteria bacterium]